MRYDVVFWVWDAAGNAVTQYARKADAVKHAARIGGTWNKGRR